MMAKEKPFKNAINTLYKKQYEDIALLFFVIGIQRALPSIPDGKAVEMFLKELDLSEDDYPFESCRLKYIEMKKLYLC